MVQRRYTYALLIAACACGSSKATIEINPGNARIQADATQAFTATLKDKDGKAADPGTIEWSTSDPELATIDSNGVATAHIVGTVNIQAKAQGVTGTTKLTIDASNNVGTVTLEGNGGELQLGDTRQLTLTVKDATGAVRTDIPVRWESRPNILAVEGTVVHPTTSGEADLRAIAGGVPSADIHFSVPRLQITVSPDAVRLVPRGRQAFTAVVLNAKNTTVIWSVQEGATGGTITSDDSGGGAYQAPCSPSGSYPQFHVVAASAADPTQTGTATVSINAQATHFDPCFGAAGRVKAPWSTDQQVIGMAVGLGQSLLVGALRKEPNGTGTDYAWLGYTFDSSGVHDTTFGKDGEAKVVVGPSPSSATQASVPTAVGRQPSGTLIMAGRTGDTGFGTVGHFNDMAVVKFDATGNPDRFFGTGGVAKMQVGEASSPTVLFIPSDGQIVAAGLMIDELGVGGSFVATMTADGTPDTSFGSNGVTLAPLRDDANKPMGRPEITSLITQSDTGHFIVGGYLVRAGTDTMAVMNSFETDGHLNTKFGTNGRVTTKFGNGDSTILAMGSLQMGRFFAVGQSNGGLAVQEFQDDGSPDPSEPFGGWPILGEEPLQMADYPGGGWLLALHVPGDAKHLRLVKLDGVSGRPDGSFGNGGTLDDTDDNFSQGIMGVAVTNDSLIRVLGLFTGPSGSGVLLGVVP